MAKALCVESLYQLRVAFHSTKHDPPYETWCIPPITSTLDVLYIHLS